MFKFLEQHGDFPGGPMVKTLPFRARGAGLIPGWGTKIPDAQQPRNQNMKQKQSCNKFNRDLKNGPYQKHLTKKNTTFKTINQSKKLINK